MFWIYLCALNKLSAKLLLVRSYDSAKNKGVPHESVNITMACKIRLTGRLSSQIWNLALQFNLTFDLLSQHNIPDSCYSLCRKTLNRIPTGYIWPLHVSWCCLQICLNPNRRTIVWGTSNTLKTGLYSAIK